ncbi:hypothetical protein [Amycolatopsis sp.]|uniref:hypothetical protein n=1 Tax=Amycolatopsis sp. TaxID=37632 RepID=UPI002E00BFF7|nr:hypothetical protein [Amycolatopsis sp.]
MGKKFWFPLALLGFVLIALALVPPGNESPFAWVSSSVSGGVPIHAVSVTQVATGDFHVLGTRADYWPYLVAAIFVATVAWYAVRAEKPRPWRRLAAIAFCGLIAIPIAGIVADGMMSHGDGRELLGTVMGLFALLGAGGAAWAYFRLGPGRGAAIIIAVMFGPLAVYAWLVALVPQTAEALLPGLGLLALAWFERSVLLASVTLAFLLAVIVFTTGLAALLVPAAVMLAGAIATLLTHRPPSADTA